jgi:hypothetical protein
MAGILGALNRTGEVVRRGDEDLFVRDGIRKRKEDADETIMIMAGGDVVQYVEIKKLSAVDYLNKLSTFVKSISSK